MYEIFRPPRPHLVVVLQQISLVLRVVQLLALSVALQAVILLAGGGGVEGGHLAWFRLALHL